MIVGYKFDLTDFSMMIKIEFNHEYRILDVKLELMLS